MGSAEDVADDFVFELAVKAAEMIETCAGPPPGFEWRYHKENLQDCLRTAMTEASRDDRGSAETSVQYLAAHAACRLIRNTDLIFGHGVPTSSAQLVAIGASTFMTGWATQVAVFILNFDGRVLPENEDDSAAPGHTRLRITDFMSVLDELVIEKSARVHHRIVADLVRCIDNTDLAIGSEPDSIASLLPEAEPPRATPAEKPTPPITPPPARTAGSASEVDGPPPTESPAPPPVAVPPPVLPTKGLSEQPWRSGKQFAVIAAACSLVVGLGIGVAVAKSTSSSTTSTPVTTTVTTTAVNTEVASPQGPELAFADPTVNQVALRLYAYPDDGALSERVMAVPEHPTQARAVIGTGQDLVVEVHLATRPNVRLDPTETIFLGLAPSGLLTLESGSSRVSAAPGASPSAPLPRGADLTPAPTTPVDLDPGGAETIYTVRLKAKAQPAVLDAKDPAYFCGFNTQYVNAVIMSNKRTEKQINTTLPVSVLRAGSSC